MGRYLDAKCGTQRDEHQKYIRAIAELKREKGRNPTHEELNAILPPTTSGVREHKKVQEAREKRSRPKNPPLGSKVRKNREAGKQ
jgi:DNA-directed RNA polymerase specialized sigma subunit